MQIYPNQTEPARPETVRVCVSTETADGDTLRSGLADMSVGDSERVKGVRIRVLSGAYDTLEIVDALARRLLVSGDL
jgi:hypothetical protein